MKLPSVVSLKQYVTQDRPPAFTRFNLFLRDAFTCQYCRAGRGPDLRPRDPALAGRAHDLGKHRHRLRALQPDQGRAHPARGAHAPGARRTGPPPSSCSNTAAASRRTTCTKAGSTTSTGTSSWRLRWRHTLLTPRPSRPNRASPMTSPFHLAPERACDAPLGDALIARGFGPGRYAKAAERLREGQSPIAELSFVAWRADVAVGCVRLWPIAISENFRQFCFGPFPDVDQAERNAGVGAALIRRACEAAAAGGHRLVLLVGDEAYFAPLGFPPLPPRRCVCRGRWIPTGCWCGRSRRARPRVWLVRCGSRPKSVRWPGPPRDWSVRHRRSGRLGDAGVGGAILKTPQAMDGRWLAAASGGRTQTVETISVRAPACSSSASRRWAASRRGLWCSFKGVRRAQTGLSPRPRIRPQISPGPWHDLTIEGDRSTTPTWSEVAPASAASGRW